MNPFKRSEEIGREMVGIVFAGLPGPIDKISGPLWREKTNTYEVGFARCRSTGRDYYHAIVFEEWTRWPSWKQVWLTMLMELETTPSWAVNYIDNNDLEALLHNG